MSGPLLESEERTRKVGAGGATELGAREVVNEFVS